MHNNGGVCEGTANKRGEVEQKRERERGLRGRKKNE